MRTAAAAMAAASPATTRPISYSGADIEIQETWEPFINKVYVSRGLSA
jgi:hypothetical protein